MRLEYSVEEPLNREPDVRNLVESFITEEGNYDRNHGPIPHLDANSHVVRIDGHVRRPLVLSIADIRTKYQQHEITSALQCAGNRRHTMRTLLKEVNGIDWGDAAVMNCRWKGARLKDILEDAGLSVMAEKGAHVAFSCYETEVQHVAWYGGSIDLRRAISKEADVLIALEMNGKTLPINNGYPVRVICPGISGCRSVKWLNRITVQLEESENLYQRYDYKRLPPEATDTEKAKVFWDQTPALQDMPINSIIAQPLSDETLQLSPSGTINVKGYALPYGDQGPITRVEVSADGGKTWQDADVDHGEGFVSKWSWSLWSTQVRLNRGENHRLLSRATDAGGNIQNSHPLWNLRGVGYDGYGEARNLVVS